MRRAPAPPCCGRPWARAGVPYPRKGPRRQTRQRACAGRLCAKAWPVTRVFAPKPRHRCCVSPGPLDQPEAIRPWPPSQAVDSVGVSRPVCLLTGYSTAVTTSLKLSRGERFGHLTAVEQARFDSSCGTVTVCKVHEVKSGHTRSCGCLRLSGTKFQAGSV
jgi:hypothetical protein